MPINGACTMKCSTANCAQCTAGVCTSCNAYFYLTTDNSCATCPGSGCSQCSSTAPAQCTSCASGYYLAKSTCYTCPAYCMVCTSSTWCTKLYNTAGFTSFTLTSTSNAPAACDPGCTTCSTANPQVCSQCMQGFYMTSNLYCAPCSLASKCSTCSVSNSAICLSCFPGYFLSTSSQCLQCTFPCIACANATATKCTGCAVGYVLSVSSSTCILSTDSSLASFGTVVDNCASALLVTASSGSQTLTCSLCLNGFANTNSGCAPCTEGCAVCNPNIFTQCINCFPGYLLNSSNLCQACTFGC
jgi:hypothetical protein